MKIKETLVIAVAGLIFLILTSPVRADGYTEVDGYLTHHYKTVETQNRVANRTCSEVDVPIYSNTGKAQTGEVLGGAIIGGILGNQVGGGKGKDAATILGAILGADFANKKGGQQTIVGYKQVEQCEIVNKVTYVKNNPTCNVTVELPSSLMNVQHSFRTGKCPALGEEYSIHTKLTIKLN
jgi:uncharacterized protein YcfJ